MPRNSSWNWGLSRAEIDQRSREARLRLERMERLLVPYVVARQPRLRRLLSLLYGGRPQTSGIGKPLNDQRPSCIPAILEVRRLEALSWIPLARRGV